jgi:hypothetical protein
MEYQIENQLEYQYNSEPEEYYIENRIRICRFCDNLKKGRSLSYYENGLKKLKICYDCKNDISALRNNFVITRIIKLNKQRKIEKIKSNILLALNKMNIGIQAGIHQHILDYII